MDDAKKLNAIHKERISEELGVSLATVNNWIKTQVIPPPDIQNLYSEVLYGKIIYTLKNDTARLSSRANRSLQIKKEICYLGITDRRRKDLLNTLIDDFEKAALSVNEGVLALSFALLRSNNLIDLFWQPGDHSRLDAFLSSWAVECRDPALVQQFYSQYTIQNLNDDILGAFYQSLQNISQKSSNGSYYTPAALLKGITVKPDKTVIDPCCGSGSILLGVLSREHNQCNIFARDVDETALKICFVNLVLFFNDRNMAANIARQDITLDAGSSTRTTGKQFDFIVTNPPWGSKFSKKEKDRIIALYPELGTSEIFSVSLYNSLKKLKQGGELFFFLPYSFLNVGAHRKIRNYVLSRGNEVTLKLLGGAFKGVLSGAVLLHVKNRPGNGNLAVQTVKGICRLPVKSITPPDYIISVPDNHAPGNNRGNSRQPLTEKIYSRDHVTLRNNTIFALGIVTGNNKKHLLREKTEKAEEVFRGKDIEKYNFSAPEYYIEFRPELYQQTAPVEYYRQKKIAYRFISDKLVCALDLDNALFLNSANILISEYPMRTLAAFLNSTIYTYIYRETFNSRKVLKSHLQSLPFPVLTSGEHLYIHGLYDKAIVRKEGGIADFQKEIDEIICKSFCIDKSQYEYIINTAQDR